MDLFRKLCLSLLFASLLFVAVESSALYSKGSGVELLTDDDFEEKVLQSDALWIVEFYADWCGHCKSFAPEYVKAAKALKGMLKVGAVESAQKKTLSKYSVQGFPTIKIFGADKTKPVEYKGGRTAKSVVETLTKHIQKHALDALGVKKSSSSEGSNEKPQMDGDVVQLTDDNFDQIVYKSSVPVFVKFFSPNCGHCRAMADDWRDAATQLKGKAVVAELDATVHNEKGSEFVSQGFPTIKLFFKSGGKDKIEEYQGDRSAGDLVEFVSAQTGVKVGVELKLEALTTDKQFKDDCLSQKLCIITFLPSLEDSSKAERKQLLETLSSVMKSDSSNSWAWFYTEGLVNEKFERAFGYVDVAYPTVLTIYPAKNAYVHMVKDLTEVNLKQHIKDLIGSRVRIQKMPKKLPEFVKVKTLDGLKDEL